MSAYETKIYLIKDELLDNIMKKKICKAISRRLQNGDSKHNNAVTMT